MKTLFTSHRSSVSRALALTVFAVTALGAIALVAQPAQADIVARGTIGGADIRVRLETPDRVVVRAPAPRVVVRTPAPLELSIRWSALDRDDHRVAARLSLLSGVAERRLLAQRSHGWSWNRIAQFHGIHRSVLAQARSQRALQASSHWCASSCCDHGKGHGHIDRDRDHDRRRGKGGRRG